MNTIFVDSVFLDPQGDDQFRDHHETMAMWRLTSGFLVGMTLALFPGVRLAHDQRSTGSGRSVPTAATVVWPRAMVCQVARPHRHRQVAVTAPGHPRSRLRLHAGRPRGRKDRREGSLHLRHSALSDVYPASDAPTV
jgi:hypothetical protein